MFGQMTTLEYNNGTQLQVIAQLDGINDCKIKPVLIETLDMPTNFTTPLFVIFVGTVNLTLSEDSKVISLASPGGPQCGSNILRATPAPAMAALTTSINTVLLVGLLYGLVGLKSLF
jgi:hypothetical protein